MSRDAGLADRLRAWGLAVVECDGWQSRGSSDFNPGGSVNHHTAGGANGTCPSLGICINGRPDLAGPLCNVLQSREAGEGNDAAYVVAAGRANHAGSGGWQGLSGNSRVWGLEIEHTGTSTLATHRQQTAALIHAAMWGGDPGMVCQHSEWTTRKIDAATNVDSNGFRDMVATAMGGGFAPIEVEDDELIKTVEFIRDPRDGGIYIVFGTMGRRRLDPYTLPNMQAHWAAKGADPTVWQWDPRDLDPIPDLTVYK